MSQPTSTTPTEMLFGILVTFLTPLFLVGPTGTVDVAAARTAAAEMLSGFRIRNPWDLFTAVQAIGFGVAALGSLGLSMEADQPINTVLRCRSNANALQRTADRAQTRLDRRHALEDESAVPAAEPPDPEVVLAAFRKAAEAHEAVAVAYAGLDVDRGGVEPSGSAAMGASRDLGGTVEDRPPPCPSPRAGHAAPEPAAPPVVAMPALARVSPDTGLPTAAETAQPIRAQREAEIAWAKAMATVATEIAGEMEHLPPRERRLQEIRLAALTDASMALSQGQGAGPDAMPALPCRHTRPAAA